MFQRFLLFVFLLLSCTATPLPQPPSLDYTRIELRQEAGFTVLTAEAGTLEAGFVGEVRVTVPASNSRRTVASHADGGFQIELVRALAIQPHFIELVRMDDETFAIAVRRVEEQTVLADTGPDADSDGFPDAVDCAPADAALGGLECEIMCVVGVDHCDGLDDDCDGFVDEGCDTTCRETTDCTTNQVCIDGICVSQ